MACLSSSTAEKQKGGEDIEKDTCTGDNCNNLFTFIKKCLLI